MDPQFNNILNDATDKANQTYLSNTASADAAQQKANQEYTNVNSEGQLANQNAAKLSNLGDTLANTSNVTDMYNKDQQSQLNNMGFDKTTLNAANQNIAQETGQLGAANNQIASEGGTRGFNAAGTENRLSGIQAQANNAIGANTAVQGNELGQANAAGTYTGQEINAQQTSQGNAISSYNDATSQNNNTMANYANTLATLANQATTYGGLVGSNVAQIMSGASSAAGALLDKYQAHLAVAQANEANSVTSLNYAKVGLTNANTALTRQQVDYNNKMQPMQLAAEKMVQDNSKAAANQISDLTDKINNLQQAAEGDTGISSIGTMILNMTGGNPAINEANNYRAQIAQLNTQVIGANSPKP